MALGEADDSGRRRPVDTGVEVEEGVDLVVVISWPPCAMPVINSGLRLARAA
jgi:hypothetical protein